MVFARNHVICHNWCWRLEYQKTAKTWTDNSRLSRPLVTIGMCVRNCEDYLQSAIESIFHQDFVHESMELIFVDDGSTDGTLKLIRDAVRKSDIHFKIFEGSWKGIGHARNMVVRNARGCFILWVDGDMVLSKDYVRQLVNFMNNHPEVGIVKGSQSLQLGGNLLATLEAYSRAASRMVDYRSKTSRAKALGTGGSICRIKAVKQVGGFDENLQGYGEDWDIELRVRDAGWSLDTINAEFSDHERRPLSWKKLWFRYWLRGYCSHYFLHKNVGLLELYRLSPISALITGLLYSRKLYPLIKKKTAFLLPFENSFKMLAWYLGFFESHLDSYEPSCTKM